MKLDAVTTCGNVSRCGSALLPVVEHIGNLIRLPARCLQDPRMGPVKHFETTERKVLAGSTCGTRIASGSNEV